MLKRRIHFSFMQSALGRVLLHLICLCRDGKGRWHLQGMLREFRRKTKAT